MSGPQEIEMQVTKAASLYTLLHIEQRVFQIDPDHQEGRHIEVSVLNDRVAVCLGRADKHHPRNGWVSVDLTTEQWDEVERILRWQTELPGAFDNDFAHQNAMTTIAADLLEHITDYREAYYNH